MADLSEKYPETVFLKVDAEICKVRSQFVDFFYLFISFFYIFFFIGRPREFLR